MPEGTYAEARDRLRSALSDLADQADERRSEIVAQAARALHKKLIESRFNVVVVGEFKRGKTTAGRALSREAGERSKRARGRRAVSRPRCPACDSAEGHAANYLTILAVADPDSEPGRAIGRHGHGLCLPHAMQGIAAARTPAERDRLVDVFLRGADELRGELAEYARKTDYRFHHEGMSEAEASAWRRAVLRLVGEVRPRRRPER